MDKQDPLADVICRAMFDQPLGELHPITDAGCVKAAAAVRSYVGSDEVVDAGREAILENLRDRRLLKWLFAEDPENHGAIGYVDGPIDADTQKECAESLVRAALSAALDIGGGRG